MILVNVYGHISQAALGGCHTRNDEPIMLRPVEWDQVKAFFLAETRRLGQGWFGEE